MTESIRERRLTTLFRLASETAYRSSAAAVIAQAAQVLKQNSQDIPSILILLRGDDDWSLGEAFGLDPARHPSAEDLSSLKAELDALVKDAPLTKNGTYFVKLSARDSPACIGFGIRSGQAFDAEYKNFIMQVCSCIEAALQGAASYLAAHDANRLKTSFLANMSHEIRTPLSAMLGYTELLRDAKLSKKETEYLHVISKNGEALTHLIDDILDLSKIEAGKLSIEIKAFHLAELITEVRTIFERKAREKGLYLSFYIDPSMPAILSSDCSRIRQILINIISNALKFTDEGGVSVEIAPTPPGAVRGFFKFVMRVMDTGLGLGDEQAETLFQPFVQLEHTQSVNPGGSGLGLALSRRLARSLGGDLTIERSALGRGSTFLIEIAAEAGDDAHLKSQQNASERPENSLQGLHILLIDDSPDNRYLLARILKQNGAKIVEASDGEEGLAKAFQDHFDIILMDIQMPRMDGYQALRELRAQHYAAPVIALTAYAMKEERDRMFEAGFDGHIAKPVDQVQLLDCIHELLKSFRLAAQ